MGDGGQCGILRFVRADRGNACRFPRPCVTVPGTSVRRGTTEGQRPTRRVQSARMVGAGQTRGPWPWGPRDPSGGAWQRRQPVPWGRQGLKHRRAVRADQRIHAFPRPGAGRGLDQRSVPLVQRPAPGQRRGGRGPCALGPRPVPDASGGAWQRRQPVPWGRQGLKRRRAVRAGSRNTCIPPPWRRPGPRSTVRSFSSEASARPMGGAGAGRGLWCHGRSRTHPAGRGRGVSLCHGAGGS
jgi:hypothetical protein